MHKGLKSAKVLLVHVKVYNFIPIIPIFILADINRQLLSCCISLLFVILLLVTGSQDGNGYYD